MDIKLFSNLALWFGEKKKLTINQFLLWLVDYLPGANSEYLSKLVPFLMEEQAQAEETLCFLLELDIRKVQLTRRVSSSISRRTDWSRTYSKSLISIPVNFHEKCFERPIDRAILGGLSAIAYEWKVWLEKMAQLDVGDAYKEAFTLRAKKLERAIYSVQKRGVSLRPSCLTSMQKATVLQYVSNSDREIFLKCLHRWDQYSINDLNSMVDIVRDLLTKILTDSDTLNKNDLFEVACHLTILKSAFDCDPSWILDSTENSLANDLKAKAKSYLLYNGEFYLKIGKGNPKSLFPESPLVKNGQSDRMLEIRNCAGINGSGYEPDVVLGFYRNVSEDPLVVFGDAKRYKKSNISGAYKETVSSTMIAYGHWGKLSIESRAGLQAFSAPVFPFFTIFYTPNDTSSEVSPLSEQLDEKSPVVIIPLEKMLQDKYKSSDDMKSWFKKLYEQVEEYFQNSDNK